MCSDGVTLPENSICVDAGAAARPAGHAPQRPAQAGWTGKEADGSSRSCTRTPGTWYLHRHCSKAVLQEQNPSQYAPELDPKGGLSSKQKGE